MTGNISGTEKGTYKIVWFSGLQKDYYRWSRMFLAYADSRKYKELVIGATTIPDEHDLAVKSENDDAIKVQNKDILEKSRKATLELLTAEEKSSVCFLRVSCAGNTRKAWLSLKERYKPTMVAEELQFVKKINAMLLQSARKNPVERFCIPLELVHARLEELGMGIPD